MTSKQEASAHILMLKEKVNEQEREIEELKTRLGLHGGMPMQPLCTDKKGVIRFQENPIVRHLFVTNPTEDANSLLCCTDEYKYRWQFAQLIGWSVSGGGSLAEADKQQVAIADKLAEAE